MNYFFKIFWLTKQVTYSFLKGVGKYVISLYKISKAEIGRGVTVSFPLNVRGNGRLKIDEGGKISRNFFFNNKGTIYIKSNSFLGQDGVIYLKPSTSLEIGHNFYFEKNGIFRIDSGKWTFGDNVSISSGCRIFSREKGHSGSLKVGSNVSFSDNVTIDVSDNIEIEDDVALGHNVTIFAHNHDYRDLNTAAWRGGIITKAVKIKRGAWIGANVTIMPGVTIHERAVIGSGAVVTSDAQSNTIYGGVPAKVIKSILDEQGNN